MNMKSNPHNDGTSAVSKIARTLLEYGAHCSFHGVSYLADRRRHFIDRLWWTVAVILSASLCSYAIYDSFLNWKENPVILSLSHESIAVGEIPFPAVTICPMIKMPVNKFNYTDVYRAILKLDGNESRIVTDEEMNLMKVASQICVNDYSRDIWKISPDTYANPQIVQQIIELAPKIDDIMDSCKFRDETKNCNELFSPTITEMGLCFSFNALNHNEIVSNEMSSDFAEEKFVPSSNWNMERGYTRLKNVDTDSYPYRVFGSGDSSGLILILKVSKPNIDHLCGGPVQGFQIRFHSPGEDAQLWKKRFQLSPGAVKLFLINPIGTKAMEGIRKYSPEVRKCYYPRERQLRFFKIYNLRNCETECLANYTLEICGCVQFSMPRTNGTKICGSAKLKCILKANSNLFQTTNYEECQCLASCSWLDYDVGEFQSPYDYAGTIFRSKLKNQYDLHNLTFSRVVAFFQEDGMIPFSRMESHNLIDLLASSGGLFGLFMGASLLSFIELIYYLTLHISTILFGMNRSN